MYRKEKEIVDSFAVERTKKDATGLNVSSLSYDTLIF